MTVSDGLQIRWQGQVVGCLRDTELETVDFFRSYKIRGRWVPLGGPHGEAVLGSLATSGHLEVTVDDFGPAMGVFFGPGMRTLFSLGSHEQAWLYIRDLKGPARLARLVESAKDETDA